MVRVSGSAPGAYSAFEFKGSLEGVGRSDVEVAGWMANAYARLDPLPADGFAGACIAVVEVIGTILFYVFLFWLESEIDDDGEEECY